MKKYNLIKIIIIFSLFIQTFSFFAFPNELSAELKPGEYLVLTPLPGTTDCGEDISGGNCKTDLKVYLEGLFKLGIGISGVIAIVVVIIGGIEKMTSQSLQKKQDGKQRIQNALWALVLVIGSYVILYQINPKLLVIDLNISNVETKAINSGLISAVVDPEILRRELNRACPDCTIGSAQARLSAENLRRLNCANCVSMDSSIGSASNNMFRNIDSTFNVGLIQLQNLNKDSGLSWGATEAFPPVVNHQHSCHYNGTCIDAILMNQNAPNIKTFIENASKVNMFAQFEVQNDNQRSTMIRDLVSAGMTPDEANRRVLTVPGINGNHFSLYQNQTVYRP